MCGCQIPEDDVEEEITEVVFVNSKGEEMGKIDPICVDCYALKIEDEFEIYDGYEGVRLLSDGQTVVETTKQIRVKTIKQED